MEEYRSSVSANSASVGRAAAYRLSRRRALGVAATGAGALALLSACGKSKSGAKGSATSAQAGKPRYGGQLNATIKSDPFDFDPSGKATGTGNRETVAEVFDSLLHFKAGPDVNPVSLVIEPGLADRWETPDAQTYIYHLHPGAKFQNLPPVNGRAVASSDVMWSIEYLSRTGDFLKGKTVPPGQFASLFEGLDQIQTPDAMTATVHFSKAFAPYLNYSASPYNPVVAHEVFDQDGTLSKTPVGTGPFQVDMGSTQKGARWVFKKNPTYFRDGRPYIDQINFLVLSDDAAVHAGFQTKQLDVLSNAMLTADDAAQLKRNNPSAVEDSYLAASPYHIYMNTKRAPLTDMRVRKALGLAINRDEFLKTFFGGQGGWPLAGAFPDTYTQDEIHQIIKYDPNQAKQLMAQAGYANGVDVEFIYPGQNYGQIYVSAMQLFQSQLQKVGINLQLKNLDKATESNDKKEGNFTLTFTPKALAQDIDDYLYGVFYPGSPQNYGQINDPQLTPMLEAQRRETDAAKRKDICRQAVRYIYDNALAFGLYYPVSYEFWQGYVKNYAPNFGSLTLPVANTWVEK